MFDASTFITSAFITSELESVSLTAIGTSGKGALMAAAFQFTKNNHFARPGEALTTLVLGKVARILECTNHLRHRDRLADRYQPIGKDMMHKKT